MYGYGEYVPLSKEGILKRVNQIDIFEFILDEQILLNKGAFYKAPYRSTDSSPGCWLEEFNNVIYFVDFAEGVRNKTWVDVLMKTHSISFMEALKIINEHFKLGLGDNEGCIKEVVYQNDVFVEEEKNINTFKERVITIIPRNFIYKDKLFWEKYGISRENLEEDKVFSVEMYHSTNRNGEPFNVRTYDICYAYTDFTNGKMKIYSPHAPKLGKWFTNCNQNDVGALNLLTTKVKLLIIAKSYKDYRVLKNLGYSTIWFQAEGLLPNETIMKKICSLAKRILIWFDNDSAGISYSILAVAKFNLIVKGIASSIIIPPRLLTADNVKDPSDFREEYGEETLKDFTKSKTKLINK